MVSQRRCLLVHSGYTCDVYTFCEHAKSWLAFLPLSEETVGVLSVPLTVTLVVKETIMGRVKLIVYECFTGRQNPEDFFTAVLLSNAAALE